MDVETIAKGLSPGRSRAVMGLTATFGKPQRGDAQFACTLVGRLVQWRRVGIGGREYRLTPLGLAVRAALLKDPDA